MHVPSPSKRQIIRGTAVTVALVLAVRLLNQQTRPPQVFLWECGVSPNCACSKDSRPEFYIDPLPLRYGPDFALRRARSIATSAPWPWKLVSQTDTTLHFEVSSFIFGFIDDVTLAVDGPAKLLHLKSASRVGYSDLGQNRRRLKAFERIWMQDDAP